MDDLDAACQSVIAAGGQIVKPPVDRPEEGIRLATAADPEGNLFSLGATARQQ